MSNLRKSLAHGREAEQGVLQWLRHPGWRDSAGRIPDWVLIDLDAVRRSDLLEREWPLTFNGDRTAFVAIPMCDIEGAGCLASSGGKVT